MSLSSTVALFVGLGSRLIASGIVVLPTSPPPRMRFTPRAGRHDRCLMPRYRSIVSLYIVGTLGALLLSFLVSHPSGLLKSPAEGPAGSGAKNFDPPFRLNLTWGWWPRPVQVGATVAVGPFDQFLSGVRVAAAAKEERKRPRPWPCRDTQLRESSASLPEENLQPLPESLFSVYALALPRGHGFGSRPPKDAWTTPDHIAWARSGEMTQTGASECWS